MGCTEEQKLRSREYYEKNKEKVSLRHKKKYAEDMKNPAFREKMRLRSLKHSNKGRIRTFKRKVKLSKAVLKMDKTEFGAYIQEKYGASSK